MLQLKENLFLSSILQGLSPASIRLNQAFESDVEILDLPLTEGARLALSVDVIAEEISHGLYTDPFLIGWMSIAISLSDLAAAGADPVGLLSILNFNKDLPADYIRRVQKGIQAACREYDVPVVGGDTNFTEETQVGSVGIGLLDRTAFLTRKGMQAGDILLATGKLGIGIAYAFDKLLAKTGTIAYQARPRVRESAIFKKYASAGIDTSDGFFPALCQLMAVNNTGIQLSGSWDDLLQEEVVALQASTRIPGWIFLAGPHGEFEVLFSVPAEKLRPLLHEAAEIGWSPVTIGTITGSAGKCEYQGREIPAFKIADAFQESGPDPEQYFNYLLNLDKTQLL